MRFSVIYSEKSKERLETLPKAARALIIRAIEERLTTAPLHYGKPLRHELKGFRRLRVGDYRIIYEVLEVQLNVYIVKIDLRRDVYE